MIRIENEPLWRQGRAQNVALRYAEAHTILKLDADIDTVDIAPYLEAMDAIPPSSIRASASLAPPPAAACSGCAMGAAAAAGMTTCLAGEETTWTTTSG